MSPRQQWPPLRTKTGEDAIFFSVQVPGLSPTGPGPENRVGDQNTGSPGKPVSSGLHGPSEQGHFRARTRPHLGDLPAAFFLQNVLQLHQQRWVILRVDSLALWKISNEEDAVLIPKNRGENFSSGFLHSDFFEAGWAAMPQIYWLLLCLRVIVIKPGFVLVINRDRKSFRSGQKFQICSDDWHRWCFWSAFRHFGTQITESFRMSVSSWMMDPTRSREMPSCSAIDLAEIRRSSKISSWIWSIISGVVNVLGRPGRGASQVEKSPRLNWSPSFWRWHTMVHIPLTFLSQWREFHSGPCFAEKKILDDSSRLDVIEIVRVDRHVYFQPL